MSDTTTTQQHQWTASDDCVRCAKCDARYGGRWHNLPCGQDETEFNAPEWDTDDLGELGQQEAWEDSHDF